MSSIHGVQPLEMVKDLSPVKKEPSLLIQHKMVAATALASLVPLAAAMTWLAGSSALITGVTLAGTAFGVALAIAFLLQQKLPESETQSKTLETPAPLVHTPSSRPRTVNLEERRANRGKSFLEVDDPNINHLIDRLAGLKD